MSGSRVWVGNHFKFVLRKEIMNPQDIPKHQADTLAHIAEMCNLAGVPHLVPWISQISSQAVSNVSKQISGLKPGTGITDVRKFKRDVFKLLLAVMHYMLDRALELEEVTPDRKPFVHTNSTNLAESLYKDTTGELFVTFKGNTQYAYKGVPANLYEEFLAAPSAGKFFNEYIKNKFEWKKVK